MEAVDSRDKTALHATYLVKRLGYYVRNFQVALIHGMGTSIGRLDRMIWHHRIFFLRGYMKGIVYAGWPSEDSGIERQHRLKDDNLPDGSRPTFK